MTRSLRAAALLAAGLGLSTSGRAAADVKLPQVLSSHMVLQRDAPVPVWGTAAQGEQVTVKFRDQTKTATAGPDGKWAVKLDSLKAGGPDRLTVQGKNAVTLEDVLVGEVWVGSGQSNMAGGVGGYAKNDAVLAKLAAAAPYPKIRLLKGNGTWQEATPANVNGASALLFAFGQRLQKELDVPVGLMLGAVGGTPSGYWLSEPAFNTDPGIQAAIKAAPKFDAEKAKADHAAAMKGWEVAAAAAKKDNKPEPRKPAMAVPPGRSTGKIGNLYEAHIRPMVGYAIRGVLWDQGESGTAVSGIDQYTLMGGLIRGWRNEWGQGEFPFIYVQKQSGGGCAFDPTDPVTSHGEKFAPLPPAVPPTTDGDYRLHHVGIMKHPATYMAVASDLGPGVHPVNKSGYGERAARVALGAVYGKKLEYYGPLYQSHAVEGDKVRVTFAHIGQGLTARHADKLQGFAVAGEDGKYEWADATIEGNAVVLSSPKVSKPVAVRYADAAQSRWANLFNKDGLPAVPFRTADPGKKAGQ